MLCSILNAVTKFVFNYWNVHSIQSTVFFIGNFHIGKGFFEPRHFNYAPGLRLLCCLEPEEIKYESRQT